jgi:hypothetical protein
VSLRSPTNVPVNPNIPVYENVPVMTDVNVNVGVMTNVPVNVIPNMIFPPPFPSLEGVGVAKNDKSGQFKKSYFNELDFASDLLFGSNVKVPSGKRKK